MIRRGVVAVVGVVLLLAGCGGDGSDSDPGSSNSPSASKTTSSAAPTFNPETVICHSACQAFVVANIDATTCLNGGGSMCLLETTNEYLAAKSFKQSTELGGTEPKRRSAFNDTITLAEEAADGVTTMQCYNKALGDEACEAQIAKAHGLYKDAAQALVG